MERTNTDIYQDLDAAAAQAAQTGRASGTGDIYADLPPAGFAPPPPPSPPQTWGGAVTDAARVAASNVPLWDRARALPDVATGKPYNQAVNEQVAETEAARKRLGPFFASSADVVGGGALGTGLVKSGLTFMGREVAAPLLRRIGIGAVEGGIYGGVHGANATYTGNLPDYMRNAGWGTLFGAGVGGALPAVGAGAAGAYKWGADKWSGIPTPVARAGRVDAEGLANLHKLGPDAMLPDAGPSMLGTAQAASQGVGENRSAIVNAIIERDKGTVARLQADREAALGPAPRLDKVEAAIEGRRQALVPQYDAATRGKPVDPAAADKLIADLTDLELRHRYDLSDLKKMLYLPGSNIPDLSAGSALNARHRVSSMIDKALPDVGEKDKYAASVLKQAKDLINNHVTTAIPEVAALDARFAKMAGERKALERGQEVLDKGKNAIHPAVLGDEIVSNAANNPAANLRLRQGTHADLERRLGTNPNDLSELKNTIGTAEDYNAQKMRMVFSDAEAQAIEDSVARENVFKNTNNQVVGGSKTGQMGAARADSDLGPPPLPARTVLGTIEQAGRWGLDKMRQASVQQQRDAVARVLAMRDPAAVLEMRDRLLQHNATVGPRAAAVDKYTRGFGQGAMSSVLSPIYVEEQP